MIVNYCDLCSQPISKERHIILLIEEKDFGSPMQGRTASPRVTYEVCSSCIGLIHKIFSVKKQKITEIEKFLEDTYKLPVKQAKEKVEKKHKYKITRGHNDK